MSLLLLKKYLDEVSICKMCFKNDYSFEVKTPVPTHCLLENEYPAEVIQVAKDRGFVCLWHSAGDLLLGDITIDNALNPICVVRTNAGWEFVKALEGDFT